MDFKISKTLVDMEEKKNVMPYGMAQLIATRLSNEYADCDFVIHSSAMMTELRVEFYQKKMGPGFLASVKIKVRQYKKTLAPFFAEFKKASR